MIIVLLRFLSLSGSLINYIVAPPGLIEFFFKSFSLKKKFLFLLFYFLGDFLSVIHQHHGEIFSFFL